MKTALIIPGHIRNIDQTIDNQKSKLIKPNDCDIFVYTSTMNTQRWTIHTQDRRYYHAPKGEIHHSNRYLKQSAGTVGSIYLLDKEYVADVLRRNYGERLKGYVIEEEIPNDASRELDHLKWEFHRVRQFKKAYECNKLMHEHEEEHGFKYDFVIRARTDITLDQTITPVDYASAYISEYSREEYEKSVFLFGGWPDPTGRSKSGRGLFDGFAFGHPTAMDVYFDVYNTKKIYENSGHPTDLEHPANQLEQHIEENNVELVYLKGWTGKHNRGYKLTR